VHKWRRTNTECLCRTVCLSHRHAYRKLVKICVLRKARRSITSVEFCSGI
jgi:hypothetical protein